MKAKNKNQKLKRELGLGLLIFYGLGNIVGAGIYVLVGKVVSEAGPNAALSFIIAFFIAAITALSYAELSSRYPVAAGASGYLKSAFRGRMLPTIVGLGMITAGATSSATLINGMVGYIAELVKLNHSLLVVIIVMLLTALILTSIKESAITAALFTLIEVGGLVAIIIMGYKHSGVSTNLEIFKPTHWDLSLVAPTISAVFLAIYAYFGFEDIVNVAEEVKRPKRNLPLAIIISLIVASVLYCLVLGVAVGSVGIDRLAVAPAPLKLVFSSVSSLNPNIIVVIGIIAAGNGIIVNSIMGSRIMYGLSEEGLMPASFLKLNKFNIPVIPTLIMVSLVLILALFFPLVKLAKFTSLMVLGVFVLVNLALLKIKFKRRPKLKSGQKDGPHKGLNLPKIVPLIGAVSCLALMAIEVMLRFGINIF